jgi:hypothetical protein
MLVMPRCGMTSAPPCGAERGAAVAIPANRQRRDLASHPSTTSPDEPREHSPAGHRPRPGRHTMLRRILNIACPLWVATPLGASAPRAPSPSTARQGALRPHRRRAPARHDQGQGPLRPDGRRAPSPTTKAKGPYGPTVAGHLLPRPRPRAPTARRSPARHERRQGPLRPDGRRAPARHERRQGPLRPDGRRAAACHDQGHGVAMRSRAQRSRRSLPRAPRTAGARCNRWRTAAIVEAALLAALILGSAALVASRRMPHMGV